MAVIDVVVPSYKGMVTEANGPFISMVQRTNCFCRDKRTGGPAHPAWECPHGKHSVRIMPPIYSSSVIHWARNQAVAQALYGQPSDGRPPADYLFLMDDDMLCEPDYLLRLASYKLDIVCGICTIRRDPPRPNIRYWDAASGCFKDIIEWDWDQQKLFEIGGAGAAFMLVKRGVLERMGKAYLDCEIEIAEDLRKTTTGADEVRAYWARRSALRHGRFEEALKTGKWGEADCWWFQFLDNIVDTQLGEAGEDMSFSWKATQFLGYKMWADPQVQPGHLGLYGYSIRDHIDLLERMRASGQYRPQENAAMAAAAPCV
jgi:hypothetical protein